MCSIWDVNSLEFKNKTDIINDNRKKPKKNKEKYKTSKILKEKQNSKIE